MCWGTGGYGLEAGGPWTAIWNSGRTRRCQRGRKVGRGSDHPNRKVQVGLAGMSPSLPPNASLREKLFSRLEFVRLVTPKIFVERHANRTMNLMIWLGNCCQVEWSPPMNSPKGGGSPPAGRKRFKKGDGKKFRQELEVFSPTRIPYSNVYRPSSQCCDPVPLEGIRDPRRDHSLHGRASLWTQLRGRIP